jgi:hypothetical protein
MYFFFVGYPLSCFGMSQALGTFTVAIWMQFRNDLDLILVLIWVKNWKWQTGIRFKAWIVTKRLVTWTAFLVNTLALAMPTEKILEAKWVLALAKGKKMTTSKETKSAKKKGKENQGFNMPLKKCGITVQCVFLHLLCWISYSSYIDGQSLSSITVRLPNTSDLKCRESVVD